MSKFPSAISKPFYIHLEGGVKHYKKGDYYTFNGGVKAEVLRVYKPTLIRRLLRKLGIKVRINDIKILKTN